MFFLQLLRQQNVQQLERTVRIVKLVVRAYRYLYRLSKTPSLISNGRGFVFIRRRGGLTPREGGWYTRLMTRGIISKKRREFIAHKFGEIGTAVIASLVIGEFLSNEPFHFERFIIALSVASVAYICGALVMPNE